MDYDGVGPGGGRAGRVLHLEDFAEKFEQSLRPPIPLHLLLTRPDTLPPPIDQLINLLIPPPLYLPNHSSSLLLPTLYQSRQRLNYVGEWALRF